MKKVKAMLKNPYLLGAQGFLAGAFLIWASPLPLEQADPPAPAAGIQLVPPVS